MAFVENLDFGNLAHDRAALFAAAAEESFYSAASWYDLICRNALDETDRPLLYLDRAEYPRAAFVCKRAGPAGRLLVSLANAYSCEHNVVLAAEDEAESALGDLAERIRRERPAWEAVVISGLDPQGQSFPLLVRSFRRVGMVVRPVFDSATWYEKTTGLSFADYLAQRPSQLRNTWRRKRAKAERSDRVTWTFIDGGDGLEAGIADYERIYQRSWKRTEMYPAFIPALIRMAAEQGAGRLALVHVDGEPAAAQFWIVWRGRACIYKLAHDERFDSLSLGTILTMRMVERVLEQDRPDEINFGRGDDPYKKLWLPRRRERWGLSIANPCTARGLRLALRHVAVKALSSFRPGEPTPPL